jgi:hypothetical protein
VSVRAGRVKDTMNVAAGGEATIEIDPGSGFPYYDSFLYRLFVEFRPEAAAASQDARARSAFVQIALTVDRRPPSRL